jgi:hypothetical protein
MSILSWILDVADTMAGGWDGFKGWGEGLWLGVLEWDWSTVWPILPIESPIWLLDVEIERWVEVFSP